MSGWLEALLGKVLNNGVNIPLSKGLNFTGGLTATLNPTTKIIDVTGAGGVGATGPQGDPGATGATGPAGADGADGGTADAAEFQLSLSGTLTDYDLAAACPGIKAGDIVAIVLTGNLTINSIIPPTAGFWCWWGIRDLSGGNFTMTFTDNGAGDPDHNFRTPGSAFGDASPPNFVMGSEEDWTAIGYTQVSLGWRILCKNSAGANVATLASLGGPGYPAPFDNTHSPLAVYNFQVPDGTDSSGNGFNAASGTFWFVETLPQRYALGGTLSRASSDASLRVSGDITVQVIGRYTSAGVAVNPIAFTTAGESDATNTQWLFGITSLHKLRWLQETSAGATDLEFISSNIGVGVGSVVKLDAVRASGVVTFYVNGKAVSPSSSALTAPTGGTTAILSMVCGTGFEMIGAKIVGSALSAAELKAEYNRTMGVGFGSLA